MAFGDTYDLDKNGQIRYPEPTARNRMMAPGVFDDVRSQERMRQAELMRRLNAYVGEPPANWQPTALSPENETRFMDDMKNSKWYKEFESQYGEPPDLSPQADYDYRGAYMAGIRPERDPNDNNRYHWAQTSPDGTQTFKSPLHPTAWNGLFDDTFRIIPDEDENFRGDLG